MTRIAYLCDDLRWIQAQRAKDLQPYLPEHELVPMLAKDALRDASVIFAHFDAIWFATWRILLAEPAFMDVFNLGACMASVTSHYNIGGGLKPDICFRKGSDPAEEFQKAIATLHRLRLVTCNSLILWEMLYPHLGPKLVLAPNGVDAEFFHPRIQPPSDGGHIAVSWVGKDKGLKNLAVYMEAYRALDGGRYRFQLVAPKKHGGPVKDRYGMRKFYWMADFLVCTSFAEGTPNPVLEAAACGIPLIGTTVGNLPEIIRVGDTGWFIEPTAESLIACIERLQHLEPHDYRRMSEAIRAEIEARWTWKIRAEAYRKALEVVCA